MPRLRFVPYREIAQEIAARLAASRSGVDPLAAWAEEVIVPSRGVAEAISGELLSRMPNGIAGLRLQTLEELAKSVLWSVRVATDAERRLAMRTAVRAVEHPMMESRGVAAMLERAYRDVRDGGLTLAELAKRVDAARGLRNPARTEAILEAWREYERLIRELNAIDAAERLARAGAILTRETNRRFLLAGFYDMTGAQLQLVESLLRAERIAAIWVPTEAPFAQPFIRAISPYAEAVREPAIDVRRAQLTATQYDTRDAELRAVCARVAALLAEGTPAREIGIVARSLEPYDGRLLERFAHEHGFTTSRAEETPLHAHRIGRAALMLLRLRDRGFPRSEVLELVRDGLRVKTRLTVDVVDAATRKARIGGGTSEELRPMRGRSKPIDDYIALVTELEELTAAIDLDLVMKLPSMFTLETDADIEAAEKLEEIALLFRRASIWNKGFDPSAVIDAIEHETLSRQPPTANRQPEVWTGELLRFRGRSFTHLFAVRMQDDVFPQRRTEDPLLPDPDRRILRLREIGDGREEEALLFALLGDAAVHVHCSYAVGDGFGKTLRPSRYLRNVVEDRQSCLSARATETDRQDCLSSTTSNHLRQLQLLSQAGHKTVFDGYLGPRPLPLHSVSPTQLEDFGECPQKFLLKHILGVTDIDSPERELQLSPRDKGTFDHAVLERFYREVPEHELDRLADIVDEQFAKLESDIPPFNRTVRVLEHRATRRILREFLEHDLDDLREQGLTPRWFEYRFGTKHREAADHPEPFTIEAGGDAGGVPVRVEGTIDRIDSDGTRFRIVDYKSGKAARHHNLGDKVDRGVRLQLALYAMAVAEFFHVDAEHVSATIKPIVVSDLKAEKFAFALQEKRDVLLQTLQIFMRAILAGEFPAFPSDGDDLGSCKYCPVNHSCRTRHDVDERYTLAQQKDPRTLLSTVDANRGAV